MAVSDPTGRPTTLCVPIRRVEKSTVSHLGGLRFGGSTGRLLLSTYSLRLSLSLMGRLTSDVTVGCPITRLLLPTMKFGDSKVPPDNESLSINYGTLVQEWSYYIRLHCVWVKRSYRKGYVVRLYLQSIEPGTSTSVSRFCQLEFHTRRLRTFKRSVKLPDSPVLIKVTL